MEDIKVIRMNRLILSDIATLETECFTHPWAYETLEDYLNNPDAHFFAAVSGDGKTVGYIGSYIVRDEAYVTNVAVTSDARRMGVGRTLVKVCSENAKLRGASFISLEVRLSNTAAIGLYKSEGFESVAVRPRFYRDPEEDALIMTRFYSER